MTFEALVYQGLIGVSLAMYLWLLAAGLFTTSAVRAETITVVSSGGFSEVYKALAPQFEAATGHHLNSLWGPSMGTTVDAVPQRIARGERLRECAPASVVTNARSRPSSRAKPFSIPQC